MNNNSTILLPLILTAGIDSLIAVRSGIEKCPVIGTMIDLSMCDLCGNARVTPTITVDPLTNPLETSSVSRSLACI
eukprot:3264179-Rhodomonas_salina.1